MQPVEVLGKGGVIGVVQVHDPACISSGLLGFSLLLLRPTGFTNEQRKKQALDERSFLQLIMNDSPPVSSRARAKD
jgi:hypothetical protein